MPQRSAIALLGVLQQHGFSVEVLELWARHCESRQTGELSLFTTEGRITSYKALVCGKVLMLQQESLTKA